jgi:hypothetical protein
MMRRVRAPANHGFHNPLIDAQGSRRRGTAADVRPLPPHLTETSNWRQSMKSLAKVALLAAVGGLVAVSATAPASAHYKRHHHRHHVWVHHGYGPYAYAPRRHRVWSGSTINERRCHLSPGSQAYEPCLNKP